jgi:hypothetical protein
MMLWVLLLLLLLPLLPVLHRTSHSTSIADLCAVALSFTLPCKLCCARLPCTTFHAMQRVQRLALHVLQLTNTVIAGNTNAAWQLSMAAAPVCVAAKP